MAETIVDDLLWENFHRVVNMSSRELRDWLIVEGAGEETRRSPTRPAASSATGCSRSWASGAPTAPPTTSR